MPLNADDRHHAAIKLIVLVHFLDLEEFTYATS
jgi:hypothetical protein